MDGISFDGIIKGLANNGPFAVMFGALFVYVLKTNDKRESRYNDIINKLADKFDEIKNEVQELKENLLGGKQ